MICADPLHFVVAGWILNHKCDPIQSNFTKPNIPYHSIQQIQHSLEYVVRVSHSKTVIPLYTYLGGQGTQRTRGESMRVIRLSMNPRQATAEVSELRNLLRPPSTCMAAWQKRSPAANWPSGGRWRVSATPLAPHSCSLQYQG